MRVENICNLSLRDTFIERSLKVLGCHDRFSIPQVQEMVMAMTEAHGDNYHKRASPAVAEAMKGAYNQVYYYDDVTDIPGFDLIRRHIKNRIFTVEEIDGQKNLFKNGIRIPLIEDVYDIASEILANDREFLGGGIFFYLTTNDVTTLHRKMTSGKDAILITRGVVDALRLHMDDPLCRGTPREIHCIFMSFSKLLQQNENNKNDIENVQNNEQTNNDRHLVPKDKHSNARSFITNRMEAIVAAGLAYTKKNNFFIWKIGGNYGINEEKTFHDFLSAVNELSRTDREKEILSIACQISAKLNHHFYFGSGHE